MSLLVTNCFHWIGFHIVNKLLESGYHVDGLDLQTSVKQNHLSMFVGRNSSFTFLEEEGEARYNLSIVVGEYNFIHKLDTQYLLEISHNKTSTTIANNHLFINMPLLFGKWMPMKEDGMYSQNEFIPFNSKKFLTEAIYIEDFVQGLLRWIKTNKFGEKMSNEEKIKEEKLEKFMYYQDNSPIQSKLEKVLAHYKQFQDLY